MALRAVRPQASHASTLPVYRHTPLILGKAAHKDPSVIAGQHLLLGCLNLRRHLVTALLQGQLDGADVLGAIRAVDRRAIARVSDVLLLSLLTIRVLLDLLDGLGVHILELVGLNALLDVL